MERITGGSGKSSDQGSAGYVNLDTKKIISGENDEFKRKDGDANILSKRNNSSSNLNKINNNNNNNNNNNTNYSNNLNNENNRNKIKDRKKSYQNNRSVDCIVVAPEEIGRAHV